MVIYVTQLHEADTWSAYSAHQTRDGAMRHMDDNFPPEPNQPAWIQEDTARWAGFHRYGDHIVTVEEFEVLD